MHLLSQRSNNHFVPHLGHSTGKKHHLLPVLAVCVCGSLGR